MTQTQLDELVARATGEDVRAIRRHGFSLADPTDVEVFDGEPNDLPPQAIDWDEVDLLRNVPVTDVIWSRFLC